MRAANRTYFGSAVSVAISKALSAVAGFAALAILSRILSKEELGGYVVAFSLVTLGALISNWGFERSLILRVAAYPPEPHDMRGRQMVLKAVAVAAFLGVLSGIALAVSGDWLVAIGLIPQVVPWLPWLVLAPATMAVAMLLQAWFRANHRAEISSMMYGVSDAARAALFALVLLFGLGILSVGLAVVVSSALPILVLVWAARGTRDREPHNLAPDEVVNGAFVVLANLSRFGLRSLDVIAIGLLADGVATATYAVAARLATFCQMGSEALQPAFSPRVRRYFASGDIQSAERELHRALAAALVVTLGVAGTLVLAAPLLLAIIGGFESASGPLMILIAGYILSSGAGLLLSFVNMTGEIRGTTLIRAVTLPIFFAFVAVFVPRYGESGAATALAVSLGFMMAALLIYVRLRLGVSAATWGTTALIGAGISILSASAHGVIGTLETGLGLLFLIPVALVFDRNARILPKALLRLMRGEA